MMFYILQHEHHIKGLLIILCVLCLFKFQAIFEVKENLHKDLNKEPTEGELAAAVNMTVPQLRRHIEVGQAARNKLIKVSTFYVLISYFMFMERSISLNLYVLEANDMIN